MARLLSTWFNGFLCSARRTGKMIEDAFGKKVPEMAEHYMSDFGGYGWKLQEDANGKYILELDSLKIRESLIAHSLIIDQIRAICGSLGISQACGKVKEVQSDSTNYYLIMEGEETHGYGGFAAKDFIRCQRWTGNGLKGYWVKVNFLGDNGNGHQNVLAISKSEFKGVINQDNGTKADYVSESTSSMSLPSAGDEIVQYGNEIDKTRQSAIYIHANGNGQPALDILTGIHSKSFNGCLACRLGGDLPNGGFGLYSKNGRVMSQSESGEVHYTLNPDGTFELGKGAISYDGKGTVTIGSNVVIKWGAQSQTTYKWAVSDNGVTAPNSDWDSTFPTNIAQGKYIWKRTFYPDGTETTELIGFVGKDGKIPTFTYEYATSTSGTTAPTKDWSGTFPTNVTQGMYIWKRTKDSDGKVVATELIGYVGEDGKTPTYTYKYATNTSSIQQPSIGWSYTFPTNVAQGTYIWRQTLDSSGKVVITELIGYVGEDGKIPTYTYKYATSTSDTTEPNGTWSDTFPTNVQKGSYVWRKTIDENGNVIATEVIYYKSLDGIQGPRGPQGDDGAAYYILSPVGSISRTQKGTTTPSYSQKTITVEAYRTQGLKSTKFTGGKMKWIIYGDDGSGGTTIAQEGTGDTATLVATRATRIEFKLYLDKVEVAQKTIPVVWNGTNGKDGKDGADGTSLHNNLLVHTDFAPKAENYAGTWLNFRSSLATISGTLNEGTAVGDTDMLSASVSTQTDMFRYDVTKLLNPSTWYVIGITMRGTGTATVYCYPDTNEQTIYVDGKAKGSPSDANAAFALTSTWRRHYIAFCTKSSLSGTKYVLVRLSSGSQADISMVTLGRPYGGGSALTADGYIQNDAQLIRMATPSNMETFCGINSLCTWRSSEREFDFYSQSLGSTIVSGQWYTLSFYSRGSGSINTYVYDYGERVLSDASADMPMADGVKETAFKNDGSHTWELTAEWVRHIYTFRVRPDGSYASPILLFRATIGTSGDFIAINQVKLEVGKNASDWCLNEMDKKAVSLPDWMKAFNGYTMSDDNYIASGNAFFGKKEEIDNTYTGCFMSSNGLQIGGHTVVGLYALDHNILKVAIDPVHQQYYFKGKVYADEGEFKGTIKADKGYFNGVVTGSVRNSTTIIDKSNYSYYTEDLNGGGIGLRFDRTDSIIYLNFNDGENKFTFEEMIFYLIPYSYSTESVSSCLALLGKTYIIYHKGLKKLKLKGKFLKSGEVSTGYETSITSEGSVVKLTLQLDKNGVFYWEYVAVVSTPNIPTISSGAMPNKNGALFFGPPETFPPVIKPDPLAE
nr:MAG TPA: tail protein [Caudoviricetes sp.]